MNRAKYTYYILLNILKNMKTENTNDQMNGKKIEFVDGLVPSTAYSLCDNKWESKEKGSIFNMYLSNCFLFDFSFNSNFILMCSFFLFFFSSRCYSQSFAFTTKTKNKYTSKTIIEINLQNELFSEEYSFFYYFLLSFRCMVKNVCVVQRHGCRCFCFWNPVISLLPIVYSFFHPVFPYLLTFFLPLFLFCFLGSAIASLYTLFDLLKPFHMFPLYTMKMFSILKRSNNDSATKKRNFSFQLHKTWHPDIWIVYIDQININLREKSSIHLSFALIVYTVSPTLKLYIYVVSLGLKIDFTIVQKQNSFDFIVFSLFCYWFFEYFFSLRFEHFSSLCIIMIHPYFWLVHI